MASITVEGSLMPAAGVLKRGERATWADTPRLRDLIERGFLILISEESDPEPVELSGPPTDPKIGAEPPAKSATTADWADFLLGQGFEFPEDATRSSLIELWESHTSDG